MVRARVGGEAIANPQLFSPKPMSKIPLFPGKEKEKEKVEGVVRETLDHLSSKQKFNASFVGEWGIMSLIVGLKKRLKERKSG